MLHLVTGPDRAALTEWIMEKLCKEAENGRQGQILIVPEQFSHEAEWRLCRTGGDTVSRFAEVLSPSRMADRVAASDGGVARAWLDQGGRLLAMALAAEQISSRIKLYAAMLRRPEFLVSMIAMVEEFQSYCLTPEMLHRASEAAQGQFAQKLEELALLYEAYLAVCAHGRADPAGKLLWLEETLHTARWPMDKTFYFDGFRDFTGAEMAVIQQLLTLDREVWVALPAAPELGAVARSAVETRNRLVAFARQQEIPEEQILVQERAARHPAVEALLTHLFTSGQLELSPSGQIALSVFPSVEEECRGCVLHAKQLLRQGARCRDIAIACTDPALYGAPLRAALEMAGLPAYYAGREDILARPVIHAILSAAQAAVGPMEYEDVALYLKSGLPLLERDRCERLDGYAYRWNLRGGQWERTWELHPRGFGQTWLPEDHQALETLNTDRKTALEPLLRLRHALNAAGNTGEMVRALHRFLEELNLRQRLEERANAFGGQLGQELVQLHDILCDSLEQTWLILRDTVRSPEDFVKLYRSVLSQYHVGTIPAGLDQIYVGTVADLRSKQVRHLLVLGAMDGNFPAYKTAEGLLTEEERRTLLASGIALAPTRADQMDREMGQIHSALSAAEDTLWLSYAGEQPAWLFRRAAGLYPQSVQNGEGETFLDVPSFAAWRLRHGDTAPVALPELERWEQTLRQLRAYAFTPMEPETVHGLYGDRIALSASRIDQYAACRFAFFLAYGLKAQPQKQARLDASAFGTLVHEVLEKTVLQVKAEGGFHRVSEQRLLEIATGEIDAYAQANFPQQAQRDAYLFRRSQAEILDIVKDLGGELRQSLFEPVQCELEFSATGDIPPVEIIGQRATAILSGFVDRVDLYEKDGATYVRVVDYKTGHKDFDYTDILNGAGLQMLIYLFALRSRGGTYFGRQELKPAGVLYLPARKDYTLTDPLPEDAVVEAGHMEERRRRGLISDRPELLAAMEADPEQPRYMPYKNGKNGPQGNLADDRQMRLLEHHVLRTLAKLTDGIASGVVQPDPIVRGQYGSCRYCDYRTVCHMDLCSREVRVMAATTAEKFWEKLEQEERDHG